MQVAAVDLIELYVPAWRPRRYALYRFLELLCGLTVSENPYGYTMAMKPSPRRQG